MVCTLLALVTVPLFAFAPSFALLALGAFIMQFFVQGAWGVIPAHLSELSPDEIRGFYPGVTYQLGNLFASVNLPLQAYIASINGGDYGKGLAFVTAPLLIITTLLALIGPENRGVEFGHVTPDELEHRGTRPARSPAR